MNTIVRPICSEDASAVAMIHAASWRSAYRGVLRQEFLDGELLANRLALWTRRLSPIPESHFGFLSQLEEETTGFSFAFGKHDSTWGTQIDNLHVLPKYIGRGMGRQLLQALCERSEATQPEVGLYLWVYEQNVDARRFYEKLGGKTVERLEIQPPGGGTASEIRYVWPNPRQLLAALRTYA